MELKLAHLGDLRGMRFNIPYYQRGYRWEARQVVNLLDDLFEFQQSHPKPNQYYCLQPLVVCRNHNLQDAKTVVFDVIDGQQRLTTLFLLTEYLWDSPWDIPLFELRYERAVAKGEDPCLWENGKLDYHVLQSLTDEDMAANPDFFYMRQAMASVQDWFEEKKEKYPRVRDMIGDILMNRMYLIGDRPFYEMDEDGNKDQPDVRFIWYEDEPTEGNSIDTFKRLNYGKTPLTSSELIKALLFQCDVYTPELKGEMREVAFRMSTEWDAMEKALQDDFMWSMLFPQKYEKASRIDLVLSFVAKELQEKHGIEINALETDKFYNYILFNKYLFRERLDGRSYQEVVKELWVAIQDVFAIFRSWFEDRELYHLTGLYLTLLNQSGKNHLQTLRTLVSEFKRRDRDSYIQWIKKEKIGTQIQFKENKFDNPEEASFENLYYGSFSGEIGKILLVYNVDITMKHGQERAYFPFKFYQETTPSLEHIHPQHLHDGDIDFVTRCRWFKDKCAELSEEELKDEKLRDAVDGLRDVLSISEDEEKENKSEAAKKSLKEKAERYNENEDEYRQMLQLIDKHFDELADISESELHRISNMALVDNITNIRLGNGLLNSKRAILLEESEKYDRTDGKQGACVYAGTWRVFRKECTLKAAELRFWTKTDRTNYLKELKNTYDEYTK